MKIHLSLNRLLGIYFLFIFLLLAGRIIYTGNSRYIFLLWNLFLAWIPYLTSCYFNANKQNQKWKQVLLMITWFLFFPNALYIVTDLIHLKKNSIVPLWFDVILLFASSFMGLMMAFVSLLRLEAFLGKIFGNYKFPVIPAILFMGSFGVTLGRFQRWNSWDVFYDPIPLIIDITKRFLFPFDHLRTWAVTFILTAFFLIIYFIIRNIRYEFHPHKMPENSIRHFQ